MKSATKSPRGTRSKTKSLGVGFGLRRPHLDEILARKPAVAWFEYTPENYMNRGGSHLRGLRQIAERHPLVAHGVGASLGTPGGPSREYLRALAKLVRETGTLWASDHLCYTTAGGLALNELMPLPFTAEAVRCVARNVRRVQDAIGVPWLVENISYYATIDDSEMDEASFIRAVVEEAGCGLLLDVNNVFVNAHNQGYDARAFIARLPLDRVVQIHLAGHDRSGPVWIDTHGQAVQDEVWKLFEDTWPLLPEPSVLIEWDNALPELDGLLAEGARATGIMSKTSAPAPAPAAAAAAAAGMG
jgi:uncharacterized protein (UPF0276 family)